MIAIIDYDIGNLAAVANMLSRLGQRSVITADAATIEAADRIILPGNGAFDACVRNLRASGLVPVLKHKVLEQNTPLLGICVGAQLLGSGSDEGTEPGLGWVDMRVRRFADQPGLRVPHMGWNHVTADRHDHPIAQTIDASSRFYFVHSYYMAPNDSTDRLLSADYGGVFAAAIAHRNMIGVQFHPEKSHSFGKRLLDAFARSC